MSVKTCDRVGSLQARTIALALKDKRSISDLALESGIPFYWLTRFVAGAYNAPNVNRVQYFYEFLTGTTLLQEKNNV